MSAVVLWAWLVTMSLNADMAIAVEVGVNPVQGLNHYAELNDKPYPPNSLREVFEKAQHNDQPDSRTQTEELNTPAPAPLERRFLYRGPPSEVRMRDATS